MVQVVGTTDTFSSKGLREDLLNAIYMISPQDTPLMSLAQRGTAKAITHEWQTDVLAAPDLNNAVIQGDEYTYAGAAPTVRVGNKLQISRKSVLISGTLEAVDKAGRASEVAYQKAKKTAELKRDMDAILVSNQASFQGSSTVPSKLGSLGSWITTNVSRGAGGVNGGYNQGTGLTVAPTAGTARAFTETLVQDAQQSASQSGGTPTIMLVSLKQKRIASQFPGIAVNRIENDPKGTKQLTIFGGADMYKGNFGNLTFIPNRWQGTSNAFLIDPKLISVDYLRPFKTDNVANTGDAVKKMILVEYTLTVKQESGHAVIDDLI